MFFRRLTAALPPTRTWRLSHPCRSHFHSPSNSPDLSALIITHGPDFADFLTDDLTVTVQSFQQSLQHLLRKGKYSTILDIHTALPALHRLVIPTHDLNFAALSAYAGLKRPLKARKLAKLVLNDPKQSHDAHTAASLLLAAYCHTDKLESAEALLFTWVRSHIAAETVSGEHAAVLTQLLGALDNGRHLSFTPSAKELDVSCQSRGPQELPGMLVWHSLSAMYHRSGAWVQCQAVLRYLEYAESFTIPSNTESGSGAGVPQLQVTALHYHHTISALCTAQGFSPALALYQEMQDKAQRSNGQFAAHPLSIAPLLQVLSQWAEVTHVGAMMDICQEVVQMAIALNRMSDASFHKLHGGANSFSGGGNEGEIALQWMPEHSSDTTSRRQETLDALLGTLFQSLGPHRGLNKFSTDLADHLREAGVALPLKALMAMIEGRARANNWRGALELYPQLNAMLAAKATDSSQSTVNSDNNENKDCRVRMAKGTMAYHWIAEAMLRDGATDALADFLVRENI